MITAATIAYKKIQILPTLVNLAFNQWLQINSPIAFMARRYPFYPTKKPKYCFILSAAVFYCSSLWIKETRPAYFPDLYPWIKPLREGLILLCQIHQ